MLTVQAWPEPVSGTATSGTARRAEPLDQCAYHQKIVKIPGQVGMVSEHCGQAHD
jgi:hypothetical protein